MLPPPKVDRGLDDEGQKVEKKSIALYLTMFRAADAEALTPWKHQIVLDSSMAKLTQAISTGLETGFSDILNGDLSKEIREGMLNFAKACAVPAAPNDTIRALKEVQYARVHNNLLTLYFESTCYTCYT